MKNFILYMQNQQTQISAGLLFIVSIALVVYLNPRESKFKYEFQKGKPWMHENLVAPFDFSIYKAEKEMEAEKQQLQKNKTIFLIKQDAVTQQALKSFKDSWPRQWRRALNEKRFDTAAYKYLQKDSIWQDSLAQLGAKELIRVFSTGILKPNEDALLKEYGEALLRREKVNAAVETNNFLSLKEAAKTIKNSLYKKLPKPLAQLLSSQVIKNLDYNVRYDMATTRNYLQSQMESILPIRGSVQEGELIIFKGNLVDEAKYRKLLSLKRVYEGSLSGNRSYYYLLGGQILIMSILFFVLFLFLYQFESLVVEDISRLTFILVNVLLMVAIARIVLEINGKYIYLVPFTILPMVMRSFFNERMAIFVHIVALLIIGFLVPNSFEFIFLQFVAGVFSVLMVAQQYKRGQLFLTAGKIILVYCLAYFSLAIIQEGRFDTIDYLPFAYFAGNGLLTLVSFPLIYFQEKIFGFVSEVSLLELSDTNNALLRELAQKAPGTFQHSLQVANLAEAAVNAVKGNTLMVRTGALYHDIGKMQAPMYFIENQSTGINPHDELSFSESAEIIIDHVLNGIKMAKRHNLPDVLIDFIRTHHGTTTVMYFYKQYIKNFPEDKTALEKFTYPGPKPFSKETAILMMADTVEAASRSLKNPNHESIDKLVERLIDAQIEQGQFENAPITLREIRQVKKIFKKMLMNIYHIRIQYPD
jgi:putative nucleotidyltransferase with HDIG domain